MVAFLLLNNHRQVSGLVLVRFVQPQALEYSESAEIPV